jgi:hypothetical protein
MSRTRFLRFGLVLWLGILALAVGGIAQTQLSTNVVVAALSGSASHHDATAGGHYMPDGTFMAGSMDSAQHDHADHANTGGHTHKGHADCVVCGPVAATASLTLAADVIILLPDAFAQPSSSTAVHFKLPAAPRPAYASRAPPALLS